MKLVDTSAEQSVNVGYRMGTTKAREETLLRWVSAPIASPNATMSRRNVAPMTSHEGLRILTNATDYRRRKKRGILHELTTHTDSPEANSPHEMLSSRTSLHTKTEHSNQNETSRARRRGSLRSSLPRPSSRSRPVPGEQPAAFKDCCVSQLLTAS